MARGLDHIVLAVRDLDAAAEFYRCLGFQVGARNTHPREWGTQNHIVQLPGTFVELLSVANASGIVPHTPQHFSFGAFIRDFLERGEGLSMLVLEGRGAPDVDEFRNGGIGDYDLFEFEREGKRPDGTPIKVAFALAFAADPQSPEAGFFTCLHRHPENLWNPTFQVHANTTVSIAGVIFVAGHPDNHKNFFAAFTGARELAATPGGFAMKTPRGDIQVLTPAAFGDHHRIAPPDTARGARLAALRFAVRDIGAVQKLIEQAGIAAVSANGALVVGPQTALGATLVFEPSENR